MKYKLFIIALLLLERKTFAFSFLNKVSEPDSIKQFKFSGKSTFSGHTRTFFMNTQNEGKLSDYYALGTGAGLSYKKELFKKLEFGTSGYFVFNMLSNDLGKKDSLSNQASRYEIGLFDIESPENKENMDKLEELYLKWKDDRFVISIGRQFIETPFINKQDGRMRPSVCEGLYTNFQINSELLLEASWINRISPRSTTRWFSIEESIGIYPSGFNINGIPNNYKNNLISNGVLLMNLTYRKNQYEAKLNNTLIDNISNTVFFQNEFHIVSKSDKSSLLIGLQVIRQDAVNEGGNADQTITYFNKGQHSWVFSSRIAYKSGKFGSNLNYTRITNDHQFLFPREWGREPFYTFMQRERNEGLSNIHAFTLNLSYQLHKQYKLNLGYGRYYLPDVSDFQHNKYGLPSYSQINFSIDGKLNKLLDGLEWNLLLVTKSQIDDKSYSPKFIMNRVNLFHFEAVINFHF